MNRTRLVLTVALAAILAVGAVLLIDAARSDDPTSPDDTQEAAAPVDDSSADSAPTSTDEPRITDSIETTTSTPTTAAVEQTEDSPFGEVADPVPIGDTTDFGDGVKVRLAAIEAVEAEGRLPGERSGPAVAVTVEMTNGTDAEVDLDRVTVDLIDSEGRSAPPNFDPERSQLTGELAPGGTASGTYVFSLPPEARADVTITVKYSADTPTVVFRGSVADA